MRRKKFLGQNFLSNRNILNSMADAAELSKKDVVLEAGPGLGSLTEILAERAGKVIAVEKDRDLIPHLQEKFKSMKNIEIIQGDVLKLDPKPYTLNPSFKIVANIPYYITSHFIRKFLEAKNKPGVIVLMIQKEVAERIVARDGKESLLSLSVKVYASAKIIRNVPRGAFSPPPEVDSAIIKIVPHGLKINQKKILALAKIAFGKKRKMLRQSLGKKIKLPEGYETRRPEELTIEDWALLI